MRIVLVSFLLFSFYSVFGQNDIPEQTNRGDVFANGKEWSVTYSPSALVNTMPGIQFGIEKKLNSKSAFELEYARIFDGGFRTAIDGSARKKKRMFLVTFYYRHTDHVYDRWVFRFDNPYQEKLEYRKTKRMIGPAVGWGTARTISGPLKFETSLSIGAGRYDVKIHDLPEDAREEEIFFDLYSNPGTYLYPIIGFSFKLKYEIF